MGQKVRMAAAAVMAALSLQTASAAKLVELRVVDKDYLMVHLRDGEVHYRDNGTGESAYLGHSFAEGDDTLVVFGRRTDVENIRNAALWTVSSKDDKAFRKKQPLNVWRKTKPMNTDHLLKSELDHWLFLRLPRPMKQGCTYTVSLPEAAGTDERTASVCFDIWNAPSEAIHVNIIGYRPTGRTNAADLYMWLGDGGQRDYRAWEGRKVFLYNVNSGTKTEAGSVKFWKSADDSRNEAGEKNLIGTDVWNIDFGEAPQGRYRLVVEDVGCSADFDISDDAYREPFRYAVRGYYYMRLGEPVEPARVTPVPRQPRFIAGVDPARLVIYKTDLTPWSKEWIDLKTDVWDEPHFKPAEQSLFWRHRLEGLPTVTGITGGHSDAFDWDRHLAHVANIYDQLLPFILTGGAQTDDNLGIRESGNGLPDLLDEARNEVDFFLSIRDGEGYSQGITNPDASWSVMFQAGCTTMAAWANAANCAMLAEAFRLSGNDTLTAYYRDEAVKAFRYAERQDDKQLDELQDVGSVSMRGRDFRQQAAAFLYNLTGDRSWEDIMAAESMTKTDRSPLFNKGKQGYFVAQITNVFGEGETGFCQLYSAAAYLTCPHKRHYDKLYANLKSSINNQADAYNIRNMQLRPSRRSANDTRWQTSQNMNLVLLAHYIADTPDRRAQVEDALYAEAGWALGRNPGNIVEMTGLGARHITDVYSSGRNDGTPGTHPGQTPFNGTETWSPGNGGDARILLNRCYPSWDKGGWPRQESYFNQRYMWVNSEFTPRETMRGKMALYAYLYKMGR